MQKVLIIKLGYSETLDPEISNNCSLGDVLRTTPILHCFKDCNVTWLVDYKAMPLLDGNPMIDRVLPFDLCNVLLLQSEQFDIVVNLEKVPGICALTDSIHAWSKYGYRLDNYKGISESYENSHEAYYVYNSLDRKKDANRIWQDVLFEMIGKKWYGEKYVIKKFKNTKDKFDIGLNYKVGSKWQNKKWPNENWKQLGKSLLSEGYSVSVQQGSSNLYDYMNWINSCKLIVTHDSLGLHLAIAFGIKIIALFGPTANKEVHLYGLGDLIISNRECAPCLKTECEKDINCLSNITVNQVLDKTKELFF